MSRLLSGGGYIEDQPMQPFQNLLQQALMPQQQQQVAIPSMNPAQNQGMDRRKAMWDVLGAIGMGLATGNPGTSAQMFQQMSQQREERKQRDMANNASAQWLKANGGEGLIPLVQSGQMTMMEAIQLARGGGDAGVYGTPIYGKDKDGRDVIGAIGKDGTFRTLDTGNFQISSGVERVDAGTHYVLLDKRSGQAVGTIPKENYQESFEKGRGAEEGKAAGSANAGAQADFDAASDALDLIDNLRNDPNRERGTGKSSFFNNIPGTAGYDYQNKVNQATSGAFLTAVQSLRGLGALSNTEGAAATQAVTRLNTATSEEAFLEALADYEKIVRRGYDRAAARMGQPQSRGRTMPAQRPATGGGGGWQIEEVD